jgi:uncharacterized protein
MENNMELTKETHNTGKVSLQKEDGWQNVFTGVGLANRDKRENSEFYLETILTDGELSDLYRGEGIAKKIVDVPAKDMTRAGFSVDGDTNNDVEKYLNRIGLKKALKNALRWSRLYGGSVILMGIDDTTKGDGSKILTTPLKEESIQKIGFFRVYDRRQVTWNSSDIDEDATSSNFGLPKFYTITPVTEGITQQDFKVHYSRIIRFIGEELPETEARNQHSWGDSSLQSVYIRVRGFGGALISTESILDEFVMGVLTVNNLGDLIAGGREKEIVTRLNQIDMSKHILNTMLVDKEEEFTRLSATVNGIKDILEFLKDVLSAVSGIPQVKLFGEQAKGIGSQAAGNIRMYYDDISDMQQEYLKPQLERIISLLIKSADFIKIAKIPDTWQVKFNNLWQMSETDLATARHLVAKQDEIYLKNGVLTPEEVSISRFGAETYSFETKLIEKDRKSIKLPVTKVLNNGQPKNTSTIES